jgi:hypothetical protein
VPSPPPPHDPIRPPNTATTQQTHTNGEHPPIHLQSHQLLPSQSHNHPPITNNTTPTCHASHPNQPSFRCLTTRTRSWGRVVKHRHQPAPVGVAGLKPNAQAKTQASDRVTNCPKPVTPRDTNATTTRHQFGHAAPCCLYAVTLSFDDNRLKVLLQVQEHQMLGSVRLTVDVLGGFI